jgi:hypothetical protein
MKPATVAFLGNAGWYECGRDGPGRTFSRSAPGGLAEGELTAPLRVDLRPALQGSFGENVLSIWMRPSLDLDLPDNNVRSLFEGCIGHEGTTDGHPWDGTPVHSTDSVGLRVYLEILQKQGALIHESS